MLECFPPKFVSKPFSHLEELFDTLTPYSVPKSATTVDFVKYAQKFIHNAVEQIEPIQADVLQGWSNLMSNNFENVFNLQNKYSDSMHPEIANLLARTYLVQGIKLWIEILNKNVNVDDVDINRTFAQAGIKA